MEGKALLEEIAKCVRAKQKVAIFVDNTSVFGALQEIDRLENKRMDYVKLKDFLADGRHVVKSNFYYTEPPLPKEVDDVIAYRKRLGFYSVLENAGYKTICLQQGAEGDILDTEIIYDMCALSREGIYDTFILVAGDASYSRIVKKIHQDTGIKVEVAFFDESCSYRLQESVSKFIDLGDNHGILRDRD